jgi:hypothetical protein
VPCVPAPAALVVIGVGGPIVVGAAVKLGLAGAVALGGGAAFGAEVCGGGAAVERCAFAKAAQVSKTRSLRNRTFIESPLFGNILEWCWLSFPESQTLEDKRLSGRYRSVRMPLERPR